MMYERRSFIGLMLGSALMGLAGPALALDWPGKKKSERAMKDFPFKLTEDEWKRRLTPEQYYVMRGEGTEMSCSSPLDKEKRAGVYHCAGCGVPLFASSTKFDSKTGWPSFYEPVSEGAIGTSTDHKLGVPRTEVHCANCGCHLGHVFEDGPPPTGQRYCMNGVSLLFVPESQ